MQARAAVKAYSARERAEASVAALRKERNRASECLTEVRVSTSGSWEEQRKHVRAALDDLEQKVREATAKFK